jgi:hypothetical protein
MLPKRKIAQNPLILRYHRLMDAFAKSDDERDFYLDKVEGFIIYVNLAKDQASLDSLELEVKKNPDRYFAIPKMTYYDSKKIMEGFLNEKIYDIDTKEKLSDIIHSRDSREKFLEFIYDHPAEFEKWQQYYQERSRIRIIEWLRGYDFDFVFEEDLEIPTLTLENVKKYLFQPKAPKDVAKGRQNLKLKAKSYYSKEALNPRPKRGRPPKLVIKEEVEPEYTEDIYNAVPSCLRSFLYTPDITSASSVTFSGKFTNEEEFLENLKSNARSQTTLQLEALSKKLESLQQLSNRFVSSEIEQFDKKPPIPITSPKKNITTSVKKEPTAKPKKTVAAKKTTTTKKTPIKKTTATTKKATTKKITTVTKKAPIKKTTAVKKTATKKKTKK